MLFCERDFNCYIDIDERSAAFFALGIAKEKRAPVILLCTSGSAVTHYFPAISEAKHSRIPLIVISADRPPELQNVGAPQTIDQINIFESYVKHFEQAALPEDNERMYQYVRALARRAYIRATEAPCGVVHLNIPIREPLLPQYDLLDFSLGRGDFSIYK